ncbi:hypothetical protein FF1_008756 [Malus domestica]
MKKLKDMGASASAVGPRRKLMHAIDCFCQPFRVGAYSEKENVYKLRVEILSGFRAPEPPRKSKSLHRKSSP